MQRQDLTFQGIYNSLLAGNKLVLHFPNAEAAESFRTRLHHHKARQEKTFIGLGLANEEERTVLNFKVKKNEGNEQDVVVYVQFAQQSPLKKYPVLILEEEDIKNANAQISTAVE